MYFYQLKSIINKTGCGSKPLVFVIAIYLILISSISYATEREFTGPMFYLEYIRHGMKLYYDKNGSYATTLADVESILGNDYLLLESKGEIYSYKITASDEKLYRIISENKNDLMNFELTNSMKYPMWFFKTDNERQKKKAEIFFKLLKSDHIIKQSCIIDLRYFPGKDIQFFLINVLESRDENLTIKVGAMNTLNAITEKNDVWLLEDLIKIVTASNTIIRIKYEILNTFSIIQHVDLLPVLRNLLKIEKDYTTYKIKTKIMKLIQKIEGT